MWNVTAMSSYMLGEAKTLKTRLHSGVERNLVLCSLTCWTSRLVTRWMYPEDYDNDVEHAVM